LLINIERGYGDRRIYPMDNTRDASKLLAEKILQIPEEKWSPIIEDGRFIDMFSTITEKGAEVTLRYEVFIVTTSSEVGSYKAALDGIEYYLDDSDNHGRGAVGGGAQAA
jgi:hypothetical protein